MSREQVTVEGTVRADGTLILNRPVELSPGPVRVVVQPLRSVQEDTWQVLERIWAESKALGLKPRSAEEIDAEINSLRDEAEVEMREIERLHDGGS